MFKLSIFLIAILFAVGLNCENFAQKRYSSRSYKPKTYRTTYRSSGNSLKYSKRTIAYKTPNLKRNSAYYKIQSDKIKRKYQNKSNYRSNTKLNFPNYSRKSANKFRRR